MSGQDILQEPRQAVFRVTENGESMKQATIFSTRALRCQKRDS